MLKVEKNQSNIKKCICKKCSSYTSCSKEKNETLFCAKAVGKTNCVEKMNGCICGLCPVEKENFLLTGYYCINGSADETDNN